MAKVIISADRKLLDPREVADLYIELGWGTRARYSPARMKRSLAACDIVVFALNDAGELVGIARALSDFALDTKILDMVIAPEYQRQGVGLRIMKKIGSLARGTAIYCETEPKNFGFVAKAGYRKRGALRVFVKKN